MNRTLALALVLSACSPASSASLAPGGGLADAGLDAQAGDPAGPDASTPDASPLADAATPVKLDPCPTSGKEAIVAPAACFVFTPAAAGSSAAGVNATRNHYALEPAGTARGELVVFFNGSQGWPSVHIATPETNIYSTLANAGFHVIALAYRSDNSIGRSCTGKPECFGATRESIIKGAFVGGATTEVADVKVDEGVLFRLDAALRGLAEGRPGAGWDAFRNPQGADPGARIVWSHVTPTGASQGGGHAAYLGRMFAVRRVVQFSSTCDQAAGAPAPWTAASEPWATSPATAFFGFGSATTFDGTGKPVGGDTTCAAHAAVWANMGMDPSRSHDDALQCPGKDPHGAPIQCVENASRWAPLFE